MFREQEYLSTSRKSFKKPLFLPLASKTNFEIYVVWHCDSLVFESVNVNSGYSNIQG